MAKRKAIPRDVCNQVLVDAMHRCCLCPEHREVVDLHHVVPISEGGPNTEENLMAVCPTCHATIHRIRNRYTSEQLRMYKERWALLMRDTETALEVARRARELADVRGHERDIIRAEWLLGAAHRARGELTQAEPHLEEALRRCRRINLIELEPNILLELACLRHAQAQEKVRRTWKALAQEALEIADRCEYQLAQADCHNPGPTGAGRGQPAGGPRARGDRPRTGLVRRPAPPLRGRLPGGGAAVGEDWITETLIALKFTEQ